MGQLTCDDRLCRAAGSNELLLYLLFSVCTQSQPFLQLLCEHKGLRGSQASLVFFSRMSEKDDIMAAVPAERVKLRGAVHEKRRRTGTR